MPTVGQKSQGEGLYRSLEVCSQILGLEAGFLFLKTLRLKEKNITSVDPIHWCDKSTSQLLSVFYEKIFSFYSVHEKMK